MHTHTTFIHNLHTNHTIISWDLCVTSLPISCMSPFRYVLWQLLGLVRVYQAWYELQYGGPSANCHWGAPRVTYLPFLAYIPGISAFSQNIGDPGSIFPLLAELGREFEQHSEVGDRLTEPWDILMVGGTPSISPVKGLPLWMTNKRDWSRENGPWVFHLPDGCPNHWITVIPILQCPNDYLSTYP